MARMDRKGWSSGVAEKIVDLGTPESLDSGNTDSSGHVITGHFSGPTATNSSHQRASSRLTGLRRRIRESIRFQGLFPIPLFLGQT